MIWLVLGLALWAGAHFWKRAAPASRARYGERGKGIVAILLVLSIVLMVMGYKVSDGPYWWGRTPAMTGINNLLVLLAFYLFASSGAKNRVARAVRHPQLIAVILWAVAHLLVNGDLPSLVLFGGLLLWAVAEIVVVGRSGEVPAPAHPVPIRKEITSAVAAVVVFVIVGLIHGWLGPWPFGGAA